MELGVETAGGTTTGGGPGSPTSNRVSEMYQKTERQAMQNEASNGIMVLENVHKEFRSVLQAILENMYHMNHSRLLTFQLNFNGVYDVMNFKDTKAPKKTMKIKKATTGFLHKKTKQAPGISPRRSYPTPGGPQKRSRTLSRLSNLPADFIRP